MSSHISDNKQHPRSRAPQGWHHKKMGNPFHENKPKIVMCTVRVIPPRLLSSLSKHEDDSFSLDKEDWLCLKYWLTLFTWCHSYDDRTPFRIELKMPFQCFNLNLTFHDLLTFKLFQVCMSFLLLKTIRIYFEKCRWADSSWWPHWLQKIYRSQWVLSTIFKISYFIFAIK